jgi:hypothetical protein
VDHAASFHRPGNDLILDIKPPQGLIRFNGDWLPVTCIQVPSLAKRSLQEMSIYMSAVPSAVFLERCLCFALFSVYSSASPPYQCNKLTVEEDPSHDDSASSSLSSSFLSHTCLSLSLGLCSSITSLDLNAEIFINSSLLANFSHLTKLSISSRCATDFASPFPLSLLSLNELVLDASYTRLPHCPHLYSFARRTTEAFKFDDILIYSSSLRSLTVYLKDENINIISSLSSYTSLLHLHLHLFSPTPFQSSLHHLSNLLFLSIAYPHDVPFDRSIALSFFRSFPASLLCLSFDFGRRELFEVFLAAFSPSACSSSASSLCPRFPFLRVLCADPMYTMFEQLSAKEDQLTNLAALSDTLLKQPESESGGDSQDRSVNESTDTLCVCYNRVMNLYLTSLKGENEDCENRMKVLTRFVPGYTAWNKWKSRMTSETVNLICLSDPGNEWEAKDVKERRERISDTMTNRLIQSLKDLTADNSERIKVNQ